MVDALPSELLATSGAAVAVAPNGAAGAVGAGSDGFRVDLNYLHEARLGEMLTVCCDAETGRSRNETTFDIRNAEGGSICRAVITLR
jgi:hypothetical protein